MTMMTTREVAEYLRYSYGYMRKLVMINKVPHMKLGGTVRFSKEEIDAWIEGSRRPVATGKEQTTPD